MHIHSVPCSVNGLDEALYALGCCINAMGGNLCEVPADVCIRDQALLCGGHLRVQSLPSQVRQQDVLQAAYSDAEQAPHERWQAVIEQMLSTGQKG